MYERNNVSLLKLRKLKELYIKYNNTSYSNSSNIWGADLEEELPYGKIYVTNLLFPDKFFHTYNGKFKGGFNLSREEVCTYIERAWFYTVHLHTRIGTKLVTNEYTSATPVRVRDIYHCEESYMGAKYIK